MIQQFSTSKGLQLIQTIKHPMLSESHNVGMSYGLRIHRNTYTTQTTNLQKALLQDTTHEHTLTRAHAHTHTNVTW